MGLSDVCLYYQPHGGDRLLLPKQRTRFFLSYNILVVSVCLSRLPSASPFNPLFPSSLISLACVLLFTCGGAAACSLRCPKQLQSHGPACLIPLVPPLVQVAMGLHGRVVPGYCVGTRSRSSLLDRPELHVHILPRQRHEQQLAVPCRISSMAAL